MFSSGFFALLLSVVVCRGIDQVQGKLFAEEVPGHPGGVQVLPSFCRNALNSSSSAGPEIQLPFVDMVVRHEMPIFVLREPEADLLLLLHGPEIHQLHVATGKRRLVPLGFLAGRVRERPALGAEIVAWRQFLLLALVLEDSLEVYQLPRDLLLSEDPSTQLNFEPLQEFSLPGGFLQLHLLKPSAEQVLLLVASNHTRTHSKCRTFEWLDTYFNPLEEITLPSIRVLQVVGRQPIYLIFGRFLRGSSARLVLTVYELDRITLRLQQRQALTVQAQTVHAFRFRSRNRLLACSASASDPCLFFRMIDGQFVVNRKHARRDLNFRRMTATKGGQLLVGARANGEVIVFGSARLDCYSGFAMTGNPDPSGLLSHRNAKNESFLLLAYRLPSSAVLRTVQLGSVEYEETVNQVGATQDEDLTVVQLHRHEFEESINGLRGLLLRRRSSLAALLNGVHILQKQGTIQLTQDLHLREGGHIGRLQLEGEHLRTPSQLKQRLEELRQKYETSRQTRRMIRSFGAENDNEANETLKVKRLRVGNLIYGGLLMPGYILDTTSSSSHLLTIRDGRVMAKTLQTEHLMTPRDYQNSSESQTLPPEAENPPPGTDCVVRRLQVELINGMSWNDFLDSLFLRSRDTRLEGRLVLQSRTKVDALQTTLLNGLVVDQLFNLRRAQVISSNIYMSAFFAPRLEAQSVNGLNFAQDIVFRGTDNETWVKTPVRINQMSVSGDLQVANRTKRQLDPDKEQRLQQYYTGRITIRGSLTVRSVQRDTENSLVMLGNQSLARSDLHARYLLNQASQDISNITFGYAKVSTPSLNTSFLGGHPVQDHLLSGGQPNLRQSSNQSLHIIFMNASVQGDILCRDYSSRLAELSREAVRHGQETNITGHKRFQAPVTVQALQTQQINGMPVSELVLRSNPVLSFQGTKRFARLVIEDELRVQGHLNVSRLNGLSLEQLLGHDLSLKRLELTDTPHLKMLNFRRLNGLPFDDLLSKISEGDEHSLLLLRKQLLIEGSVRFEKPLQVQTINGIPWNEYLGKLVRPDANAELSGRKSFLAGVQLSDALHTPHINNLDLSSLLDNTLLRMTPQEIGGAYSFGRMVATNVDVPQVNGVPRNEFIDTRKDVQLKGDFYVKQLTINGSLKCPSVEGEPGFGLDNLEQRVELVKQLPWRNLIVTGDALWDVDVEEQSQLDYLRQHAVRREGNQSITGHVLLRAPHLKRLHSKQSLPADLNFSDVAEDALLRWTGSNESQVITANHELLGPVRAGTVHLVKDAHFGQMNGIDIERLNASLYRLSSGEAIAANLHFLQAPTIGRLQLEKPEVNGAPVGEIFQQGAGQSWPRVRFRQLHVEQSLSLGSVNGMSMDYFFQHRIPLKGAALEVFGSLTFEQLQLGKPLLRTINGIPLDNLVLKHSRQVQSISGAKTFHGGVQFTGPGHVINLNGRDLSESYRGSIFRDRDYNIDSLVLDRALFSGGLVQPQQTPIPNSRAMEGRQESNPLKELQELLTVGNQSSLNRRLLYLDHDSETLKAKWVKPPLKGPADFQVSLPLGQTAPCQRHELRAQLRLSESRVFLLNATTSASSSQLTRISSGDIKIKVQNHCHRPARRLRSRISISCRNESHTLAMRQPVEAMHLLEQDQEQALLLLGTEEEVRILRLNRTNCSLTDWQSVTPADGRLMKVLRMKGEGEEEDLLLTSGMQDHRPVLAIHARDPLDQRFKLLQLIPGSYDLAELQEDQLLLACPGCRHIAIFSRPKARGVPFEPRQQLSFEKRIQQLTPFRVGEEQYLLVVMQPESEHFYLFKYGQVDGWQQRSFGHKKQQQWAFPLVKSDQRLELEETPLLLLCDGVKECSLVKALLG
ncbi:uncharacterized protein LOC110181598 [Drosophila serrata]|uniref:uncharacterized protein LOC110181598 n=1 Tax=Drosophila serrata TaxID=7274 RepID=UPI000A1D0DFA|nr:uncharacterized protein LOC110181598 [Drosophila serrata]